MKHSIKFILPLILTIFSCSSTVVIDESASAKQLIQCGQDEFSGGRYKNALVYYNAALDKFGESDKSVYVEAQYEIGHIYMKQKKYDSAEIVFTEIASLYEDSLPGQLPGSYRKLAQIELEKIAETKKKNDF